MTVNSLSEEDIKLRYITPAILQKGWSVTDITMETQVKLTDGKINLRGNLVARGKAKYADYMLYYNRYQSNASSLKRRKRCYVQTSCCSSITHSAQPLMPRSIRRYQRFSRYWELKSIRRHYEQEVNTFFQRSRSTSRVGR